MSAYVWTDERVRKALGLRVDLARPDLEYARVSTDSRRVGEGDLYVALVGEHFDGHDFVAEALAKGARGAVVSRPAPGAPVAPLYPVSDTLAALGALAAWRRRSIEAPVVAITGSSGKTSTKNMTAAALGAVQRVHATAGNLNNRIGMPLTLLSTPEDAEAVVLELGTNEPGEIATLAQIARPDVGVITTVGESHLEKLGSLDGVLQEKLDLLRHMSDGGKCLVGDEPPHLAQRAEAICSRVRVVGWGERASELDRPVDADVDVFGVYTFVWRGQQVTTPIAGRHGVANALLALAVADTLGVSPREAVRGLAGAEGGSLRGETRRYGDLSVIVDCYNANPQSVRAALDVLEHQGTATRRVVVLGSMLELGDHADRLHDDVLDFALQRDIDLFVLTGGFAAAAARSGIREDGERTLLDDDWTQVYPRLRARLAGDEIVLLKASRGIALEGMLEYLADDFAQPVPGLAGGVEA